MHAPDVFYIRLNGLELQTERILDPSLRNRPVAIISSYDSKGTIVSLSKEAEDDGLSCGMKISMAKRNNVEMAIKVAREARQILGGMGITGDYSIMRHMMNLESVITYEGTHDIHLLITGLDITGLNAFK